MGGILSLSNPDCPTTELNEVSQSEFCKRQKISVNVWEDIPDLIPSLPNEISIQILARLPRNYYLNAKLVCRGWKAAVTSPELYKVRKELGTTEEWLYVLTKGSGDKLLWYGLDPVSRKWQRLPPVPSLTANDGSRRGLSALRLWSVVSSTIRIAGAIRGLLGKKDSIDQTPFCGCAIGAVNGCLYVLGGFCKASTMRCVWRYDPITNTWNEVSPMCVGRAYCKTGVLNGKLYVVGGVTRDQGGLTPLQSAEVFDPHTGVWVEVPSMPFTKAHMLPTAFLADFLKPMATGISSYRGKLYVPQSLYCWPFFVDAGGEVYDPETNSWVEMPMGMGEGWPARQAGTKLSVIVDGELYALDPSSSFDSAKIKVYDSQDDSWKAIEGDIPIRDLTDSESPYLLAGLLGKLNVITKDANQNILVLQADRPNQNQNQNQNENENAPSPQDKSSQEHPESALPSDTNIWRVIASRNSGSAELISCQILDM